MKKYSRKIEWGAEKKKQRNGRGASALQKLNCGMSRVSMCVCVCGGHGGYPTGDGNVINCMTTRKQNENISD